jgi:multidrug efflux pump subunit AcrA (membrane-fusion protein)
MKSFRHSVLIAVIAAIAVPAAQAQTIELVPVIRKTVSRTVDIPGELQPFLNVTLHARVTGYVEKILVDRGSVVKLGDLLVELSAPEMKSQIAEAESKVQEAESDRLQAEGKLASLEAGLTSMQATLKSAQATYDRIKRASETPGVVAANELDVAQQNVEAQRAGLDAQRANIQAQRSSIAALASRKLAAEAGLHSLQQMEGYLKVTAPFDGVVSERDVHPGALVGPSGSTPLLVLQQVSQLRLVVAVPEESAGGIVRGAAVPFAVPAYPTRKFSGTVARIPPALDAKTRSLPVELDVPNKDLALAPGMYPTVHWSVHSTDAALYVPKTSVVTTTERTFVVREKNGRAEWVNVQKGAVEGDLVRVIGPLQEGDRVVKRATDEMREGTELKAAAK